MKKIHLLLIGISTTILLHQACKKESDSVSVMLPQSVVTDVLQSNGSVKKISKIFTYDINKNLIGTQELGGAYTISCTFNYKDGRVISKSKNYISSGTSSVSILSIQYDTYGRLSEFGYPSKIFTVTDWDNLGEPIAFASGSQTYTLSFDNFEDLGLYKYKSNTDVYNFFVDTFYRKHNPYTYINSIIKYVEFFCDNQVDISSKPLSKQMYNGNSGSYTIRYEYTYNDNGYPISGSYKKDGDTASSTLQISY